MAEIYINVSQKDLTMTAVWSEDLTGYTAKMFYYRKADGVSAEVEKAATLTPGASESTTAYTFLSSDTPFAASGPHTFSFEITKASRSRRCRPSTYMINADGEPAEA